MQFRRSRLVCSAISSSHQVWPHILRLLPFSSFRWFAIVFHAWQKSRLDEVNGGLYVAKAQLKAWPCALVIAFGLLWILALWAFRFLIKSLRSLKQRIGQFVRAALQFLQHGTSWCASFSLKRCAFDKGGTWSRHCLGLPQYWHVSAGHRQTVYLCPNVFS